MSNVNTHVSTTIQQVKSTETNSQQQNNKDSVKDLNQNNLFANLNQSTLNPSLLKSKSDSKLNSKSIHPGHIKSQSKIHQSYVKYLNQSQEERQVEITLFFFLIKLFLISGICIKLITHMLIVLAIAH